MRKPVKTTIEVRGTAITILSGKTDDYISLTDIARHKDSERTDSIIQNWLRNRNTIEFLGVWEQLNNPDFNPIEFDGIRKQAGLNSFVLTAKRWIDGTGAVGLISKPGRYGGTYTPRGAIAAAQRRGDPPDADPGGSRAETGNPRTSAKEAPLSNMNPSAALPFPDSVCPDRHPRPSIKTSSGRTGRMHTPYVSVLSLAARCRAATERRADVLQ